MQNTINKKIKDIEEVESFYELLENGNIKYFICYKNFSSIKCPISFAFCSAFIISSIKIKLEEKKIQAKKPKVRKRNEDVIKTNSFKQIKNLQ